MKKDYKRSFIRYNMLTVSLLLLIVLSVSFFYMRHQSLRDLQSMMAQFVEPVEKNRYLRGDPPPELPPKALPPENSPEAPPAPPPEKEAVPSLPNHTVSVFFYDKASKTCTAISEQQILTEEKMLQTGQRLAQEARTFGKIKEDGIYFYYEPVESTLKIAVVRTSYISRSLMKYAGILLLIYGATLCLMYGISRRLAAMAVKPLERAFEMETQFVTDTSHDLKTPIAVISANVGIIKKESKESASSLLPWIDNIEAAVSDMRGLIDEMLTLSELDFAPAPVLTETVDLSDIVQKNVLQLESVAYEKGITLTSTVKEGVTVLGNSTYIRRIVQCLLDNAIKYEPENGEVIASLEAEHSKAKFSVKNTHSYLSEKDREKIFDRFYRGDSARSANSGHGLGLSICKKMTEALGGKIMVQSAPDKGTVFTVLF